MPDADTPAWKAAEEIFNLIKARLEEQLPFLQFHEAPQNDLSQIAAIIERHMVKSGASDGAALITRERRRQIEQEGFDGEHDSMHADDALAWGAMFYALPGPFLLFSSIKPKTVLGVVKAEEFFEKTQWSPIWAKRNGKTRVQQLIAAGALIAAEIDRLKRQEAATCGK